MHPDLASFSEAYLNGEEGVVEVLADWFVERGAIAENRTPRQICEIGLQEAGVTKLTTLVPMGATRGFLEREISKYNWSKVDRCEILFGNGNQRKSPYLYKFQQPIRVKPRSPKLKQGFRIECRLKPGAEFPYKLRRGIAPQLHHMEFERVLTTLELNNWGEFALVGIAQPIFNVLRYTKQIPGRRKPAQAMRYAADLLAASRGDERRRSDVGLKIFRGD